MIRPALFLSLISGIAFAQETAPPAPATEKAAPAEQILRPPEPGRFKTLFQPFRTDTAALSPDGKFLAYSVREADVLSVIVVEVDNPGVAKAKVQVINDRSATPMLEAEQNEPTPGVIRWMRWVTPTRILVETNQIFSRADVGSDWQSWRGAVLGFNADGSEAKVLADPTDLPEFAEDAATPFSVARNTTLLGTRPDQPPTEAENQLPGADLFAEEETEAEAGLPPPASLGATAPRTFRIFDLDPDRPEAVTLLSFGAPRAAGNRSLGFHSLDARNGKLTDLTNDFVSALRATLIDRQGHVRLSLPDNLLSDFPFRYDYHGPKGRNRGQSLDEATGLTGFSVSPENFFGERSIPLGFDRNPDLLYYASNVDRDTYGIYSVNLGTKQRGKLSIESPAYDLVSTPANGFAGQESLVFDRYTRELIGIRYEKALRTTAWLRPEFQSIQDQLEKMLPGRSVQITDWDEKGNRIVFTTEGPADPGAFYLFDRAQGKLMEFVRRAPWIDEQRTHSTLPFSYSTTDGARISGLVTAPKQPRMKPIPMVVICPDFPWQRVHSDFQSEVQALADMGFAIVQLNGRGAWGLGLKQRQSLTSGYDLVQVDDILTVLANLRQNFHVNPNRVALMGRGHGGYIALRALQAHPDKFRCAVAIESMVNLGEWLELQRWTEGEVQPQLTKAWLGNDARLKAAPLVSDPGALTKPVLLLNYPGPGGAQRRPSYLAARSFAAAVRRHDGKATLEDLSTDYMRRLPGARGEVFDRIEEFLNVNIYDFNVKMPDLKILKETTP